MHVFALFIGQLCVFSVEFEIPSEGYDYIMMAMLHCLEFLVKKSLKSFLDATAKRWIPCVVEILKLDADEVSCNILMHNLSDLFATPYSSDTRFLHEKLEI